MHSPINGHFSCFQFSSITDNAAMDVLVQVSLVYMCRNFGRESLKAEFLGPRAYGFSTFLVDIDKLNSSIDRIFTIAYTAHSFFKCFHLGV